MAEMVYYNDTSIMLEAVACGQGIGLSNSLLAEADLRSGRLVRLFDFDVTIDDGYYLLSADRLDDRPATHVVRAWLQQEARLSTEMVRKWRR